MLRRNFLLIALATSISRIGWAQSSSSRPIKIVVPFAPGGGNDVIARQLAKELSELRKQSVLVENKPGAGGNIGTEYVVRAPADEITLLLGHTGTVSINPALLNTGMDATRDLEPIALLASTSLVLVVAQDSKIKSVQNLIDLSNQRTIPFNYGSSGNGTGGHLTGELFKEVTGVKMSHIPYKGTSPALVDVAGGQLDFMFSVIPPAMALIQSGKLRAIAVTSKKRLSIFPEVPTIAESNIKSLNNFDSSVSYGVLSSNKISPAIAKELSSQILKIGGGPEFQSKLLAEGAVPALGNGAEYSKLIQAESKKWTTVIKKSGAVPD
ncbi:tripartite tricarboxylate transporter substrate binding protein [Polynucleobacter sp. MWH-Aus1W21]|uniref:Bug family tripartite tricarboxylate transporter substrate binding protein n=1 Tax=Polynucleobacter sp. MWH-Aus1W21 TaxID=1855880 RepID=UPI001BFE4F4E|nr:tripartite tricarboxylate transporter substrate binding protein [Polynucleobacter sp. MWH-Aus1W21]QWD66701.1 tripartite tricarboxylate transporter substrate binding protein [Polynucleobacter sp. MWH-Aus1W21]